MGIQSEGCRRMAVHSQIQEKKQSFRLLFLIACAGGRRFLISGQTGECMERRRGGTDTREMRRLEAYRREYGRKERKRGWGPDRGIHTRTGGGFRIGGGDGRKGKLLLILAAASLLLFLLFSSAREILMPGPEGEYIAAAEAENLTRLLEELAGRELPAEVFADGAAGGTVSEDGYLLYKGWERIAALFPECGYALPEGYRGKDRVLLSDWYGFFDVALAVWDTRGEVRDVSLLPVGTGADVTDGEGNALASDQVFSLTPDGGVYAFLTERMEDCLFRPVTAVCRDGVIYAVKSVDGRESRLSNLWIVEAAEEGLLVFAQDREIRIPFSDGGWIELSDGIREIRKVREQVADLRFEDGSLCGIHAKTGKISGKILRVEQDGVEIEGSGFLPFADSLRITRIYGTLKSYEKQDLRIGYDFTDFVIEDGCVQAALVVKEENMEKIRVLVRTDGFSGLYHETVSLTADCGLSVFSSGSGEEASLTVPAGETLSIDEKSGLFSGENAGEGMSDIVRIEPSAHTGRIRLHSVERSQGTPEYRGCLELRRTGEGILVINELLLEEYLYAVVPSEMPASYPLEALKAQAVCARTYAYARILHAGLPEYGAHVDDSTSFQVYNNILENAQTTKAVRETKGELLWYGQELADTYYYSTSCGYGTDPSVWSGSDPGQFPYLQGKAVNAAGVVDAQGDAVDETADEADIAAADVMKQEESFSAFIRDVRPSDFESAEPWYRWTYQADELDTALLYERLLERCAAAPNTVFVRQENGEYVNETPSDPGRILELSITERGAGGVAQTLRIVGEKEEILVKTENAVRAVLCDPSVSVIRQDGSAWQPSGLLPSGFFTIETVKKDGAVAGFTLYGGGFGHGVGMSQNGARSMAENGCDWETILSYFYEGISLKRGDGL